MICRPANSNHINCYFSLSTPVTISASPSNRSRILRQRYPSGRFAIVADHYRLDELVSAFRAGANGYFVDVMRCDVFIKSVELVMMGETFFPPAFLSLFLDSKGAICRGGAERRQRRAIVVTSEDTIAPQFPLGRSRLCVA